MGLTRSTRGPGWARLTLFTAMSLLVMGTGCGEEGMRVIGEDPVIIVHDNKAGHLMGLGVHTLAYDASTKCILLRPAGAEGVVVPVWPRGVEPIIHDGKRGVQVPGLGRVLEGEAISLGGSMSDVAPDRPCKGDGAAIITPP